MTDEFPREVVFVLTCTPINAADVPRTIDKVAQVFQELTEDGVQCLGATVHIGDDAKLLRAASQSVLS